MVYFQVEHSVCMGYISSIRFEVLKVVLLRVYCCTTEVAVFSECLTSELKDNIVLEKCQELLTQ